MPEPLYVLVNFVLIFINIIIFGMFIRSILFIFGADENGRFMRFLYVLTEPMIMPIRKLFRKLNWFQNTPFDMAHLFTYLVLYVLEFVLESFLY